MQTEKIIKILLVEDDVNLAYLLTENLRASGYEVAHAKNGSDAIRHINTMNFDVCLFDIMLPEIDGFAVAKVMRERQPNVPFIFLTARTQEKDKLHGFEIGADDYVTKPFSFKELHCRIMVALRRGSVLPKKIEREDITLGTSTLYGSQRILSVNGLERKLSQREFELLAILLRNCGTYVSRSEILQQVWGRDDYFTAKSMDVYMTRIRKLLKEDPALEVENLYGTGYRIKQNSDAAALR
jgi:DNA-binding response OmpR family regulator